MKRLLALAIVLAAACSPAISANETAQPDISQVQADWTDPSGRFSLSYTARGWQRIEPMRHADDVFEIAGPNDRPGRIYMCSLLAPERGGLLHGSQAQINADMRRRTVADDVPPQWSSTPDFQFAHATVDGVAVIDMSLSRNSTYQRWRTFRLPGSLGSTQHQLTCGATLPVSDAERADLEAIITSLHFTPER